MGQDNNTQTATERSPYNEDQQPSQNQSQDPNLRDQDQQQRDQDHSQGGSQFGGQNDESGQMPNRQQTQSGQDGMGMDGRESLGKGQQADEGSEADRQDQRTRSGGDVF